MSYSGFQSQYPTTLNPMASQYGQVAGGQQTANPWSQMMGGYGGYNPYSNPIMGYSNPTSLMSNMGYGGYNPYAQQGGYGGYTQGPAWGSTSPSYPAPSTWQQNLEEDLTPAQLKQWEAIQKKAGKAGFYDVALPPKMEQYGAGYNTPGGYNPRGGWSGMEDVAATQTWGPGPELTNPIDLTTQQQRQWEAIQKNLANRGFDVGATLKQKQAPTDDLGTNRPPAPWSGGFPGLNLPTGRYGGTTPPAVPEWLRRRRGSGNQAPTDDYRESIGGYSPGPIGGNTPSPYGYQSSPPAVPEWLRRKRGSGNQAGAMATTGQAATAV